MINQELFVNPLSIHCRRNLAIDWLCAVHKSIHGITHNIPHTHDVFHQKWIVVCWVATFAKGKARQEYYWLKRMGRKFVRHQLQLEISTKQHQSSPHKILSSSHEQCVDQCSSKWLQSHLDELIATDLAGLTSGMGFLKNRWCSALNWQKIVYQKITEKDMVMCLRTGWSSIILVHCCSLLTRTTVDIYQVGLYNRTAVVSRHSSCSLKCSHWMGSAMTSRGWPPI